MCSGAQPVGDMAEAVLEVAEDAVVHPRLDPLGEIFAERAVDGGARLIALLEQKRQIDEAEFRHAVGQIARRLVAEREHAILDQPQNLFGAVAEIHDVPDILDVDTVAELRLQRVADQFAGSVRTRWSAVHSRPCGLQSVWPFALAAPFAFPRA